MTLSSSVLRDYLDQYHKLTDEEFVLFSSYLTMRNLHARQQLVKEGEVEDGIYYVVKGILRKYFRNGVQEIVTGFYKENELCHSAVSYYTGLPSNIIIEAIEPTLCLCIRRNDLESLFIQIPALEKIFRSVLATLYVKKDIEQMNNLRYSKKERFLQFCEQQPDLLQRVPQKQLASFLEITPETFCRLKHVRYKMAKEARK